MSDPAEIIGEGRLLVAFTAPAPTSVQFMGEAIGYFDQPVYMIRTGDGREATWAATLTREATDAEAAAYWRARALEAESGQRRGAE